MQYTPGIKCKGFHYVHLPFDISLVALALPSGVLRTYRFHQIPGSVLFLAISVKHSLTTCKLSMQPYVCLL